MSILNCLMNLPNVSRHSGTIPLHTTRVSVLSWKPIVMSF